MPLMTTAPLKGANSMLAVIEEMYPASKLAYWLLQEKDKAAAEGTDIIWWIANDGRRKRLPRFEYGPFIGCCISWQVNWNIKNTCAEESAYNVLRSVA